MKKNQQNPEPMKTKVTTSEADRFVDFARKLVNVPKSEIDKKAEEYHKRRIKEREAARKPSRKPSN